MNIINLFKSKETIIYESVVRIIQHSDISGSVKITEQISEVMIVKNTVNKFDKVIYANGAIINPINIIKFCNDNNVNNIELFTKTLLNKLKRYINRNVGNSDIILERTLLVVR